MSLACTPHTEEGRFSGLSVGSSAQAEKAPPRFDLRTTTYSQGGHDDDGYPFLREGTYFYEAGDHLFPRRYEGTSYRAGSGVDETYTWTLDADGFPVRLEVSRDEVLAMMGDDFWYAIEYTYDKSLYLPLERHLYCYYSDGSCDRSLPEQSVLYEYDDAGRILSEQTYEYFPGSKEVRYFKHRRYVLQEALLPGTSLLSFNEELVRYSIDGLPEYASKVVFSDEGMPAEAYLDEDGSGDFSPWYSYEITQDLEGRPVRIASTSDEPDVRMDWDLQYGADGLLSAYISTVPDDEDPEVVVATHNEFSWHENPAGALRPGRYTVYRTIDGEPSESWDELEWTEDHRTYRRFDVSGEEQKSMVVGLEKIEMPEFEVEE
jgi:hypothetical protein